MSKGNHVKTEASGHLTRREAEVLQLLAYGHSTKEIACTLCISYETVKRHQKNMYSKLGVHSKIDALRKAGLL